MMEKKSSLAKAFKIYLIPGIIFQSVIIGGGYGTGREVVQYFGRFGSGGLWGLVIAALLFALMLCLSFEFSRLMRAYDYKTWVKGLLGPAWPLYDILYFFMAILVIAVLTSAAATIIKEQLGLNFFVSAVGVALVVGILMFYGRKAIEGYKTVMSVVLYATFIALFITVISQRGPQISAVLSQAPTAAGWAQSAGLYVMYNLVCIVPVLWFCDVFENRKQAIISGLIATLLGIIPAMLTYFSMMAFYPDVVGMRIPWVHAMEEIGVVFLMFAYYFALGATLIETSVGMVIGFTQRVEQQLLNMKKQALTSMQKALGSVIVLVLAVILAQVGIIALVARGYTIMGYGFLVLHALPLVTIGLYKIVKRTGSGAGTPITPGKAVK